MDTVLGLDGGGTKGAEFVGRLAGSLRQAAEKRENA